MTGHHYSPEEIKFILSIQQGIGHQEITDRVNAQFDLQLTKNQIKGFLGNRHLNTGRTGRFKKGHEPQNKGVQSCASGSEKTWFLPGHMPANHRPVGSERTNVDGYTEIKVAEPKKWKMKHVLIWETENGPLPKGHAVIFGDGDKTNLTLKNLILVTRGELAILNHKGLIQGNADLTRTGVLIARVLMGCRARKKKKSGVNTCNKFVP